MRDESLTIITMLIDHAKETYICLRKLLRTACYEKGLSLPDIYEHFAGSNIDGVSPKDLLVGMKALGIAEAKMADAQVIVRAFVREGSPLNLITKGDFQRILLSEELPIFEKKEKTAAMPMPMPMPSEVDLKVAAMYCSDLTARRPFEDFQHTPIAVKLRLAYTNPWFRAFVQGMFVTYVIIGAFDIPFTCTPTTTYAEKCVRSESTSWMSTSRILELVLIVPLVLLCLVLQTCFRGLKRCAADPWWYLKLAAMITVLVTTSIDIKRESEREADELLSHYGNAYFARLAIRPFFVIEFSQKLRMTCIDLLYSAPRMIFPFALSLYIAWFMAMGGIVLSLDDGVSGGPQFRIHGNGFNSTGEALYSMWWWATGNNPPYTGANVANPGTMTSPWWQAYFSIVTFVLTFVFISLLLSVVYDAYKEQKKASRIWMAESSWKLANRAFEKIDPSKTGLVSLKIIQRMFYFIRSEHSADAAASHAQDLWALVAQRSPRELAGTPRPEVDVSFLRSMLYDYSYDPRSDFQLWIPKLAQALASKAYAAVFAVFTLFHCIFMWCHMYRASDVHGTVDADVAGLDFYFVWGYLALVIYALDALALIISFGPIRLVLEPASPWYLFRALLTLGGWIAFAALQRHHASAAYMMLLYTLYSFFVLEFIPSFRSILRCLYAALPKVIALIVMVCALMYFWSAIGMAALGGKIVLSNPDVAAAANDPNGAFYTLNFNSMSNGLYTLLIVLTNSAINTIQNTFEAVLGVGGAWFLQIFYIYAQVVVFNVFVSLFLDVYAEVAERPGNIRGYGIAARPSRHRVVGEGALIMAKEGIEGVPKPGHVVPE